MVEYTAESNHNGRRFPPLMGGGNYDIRIIWSDYRNIDISGHCYRLGTQVARPES